MPRILPSNSHFGLAAAHFGHQGQAAIVGTASTGGDSSGGCSGGSQTSSSGTDSGDRCHAGATLFANLSNSNGATGLATFNATDSTLTVKVSGAATGATLTVTVNSVQVGTVATDASGNGTAKLTNVTAQAGQTVAVGDLQGTLAQAKFTASLTSPTNATGVSGEAEFSAIKSKLEVEVTGGGANTTYNVTVDNVVVGQVTTNSAGSVKIYLSLTNATIKAGSTITISDTAGNPAILQGTFA
jgi:hypothetical protein